MRYSAAADGGRWQQWNTGRTPANYRTRVPEPWVHAVADDSAVTLCGRDTADLEAFPLLNFNSVHPELRCPHCPNFVESQPD